MHIFSCYELNINKPKCKPNRIIDIDIGIFHLNRPRMIHSTIYISIFHFHARTHLNNRYYLNLVNMPLEYPNGYR